MRFTISKASTLVPFLLLAASMAASAADSQPEIKLLDLKRHPTSLSQYRGKLVVLNFWATWCTSCKEELPLLIEEQTRYADRGVQVIAASLDDATTVKKVGPYAKQAKFNFPVWIGATVDDLEKLKLGQAVPDTVFFDQEGNLVGRVLGELRKDTLEHRLEWLLGNRQGDAPQPVEDNLGSKK